MERLFLAFQIGDTDIHVQRPGEKQRVRNAGGRFPVAVAAECRKLRNDDEFPPNLVSAEDPDDRTISNAMVGVDFQRLLVQWGFRRRTDRAPLRLRTNVDAAKAKLLLR